MESSPGAHPPPEGMPPLGRGPSPTELNGTAVAAFIFGLLGLSCLPVAGGITGILLGRAALRELRDKPDSRQKTGRCLARAGLLLGVFSLVASLGCLGWLISLSGRAKPFAALGRSALPPRAKTGGLHLPPPRSSSVPLPRTPSVESGTLTAELGPILLVDLGAESRALTAELKEQQELAAKRQQKFLLWTTTTDCDPCSGTAASLLDPEFQRTLGPLRLVRVDVKDWAPELERLGLPSSPLPSFILLGPDQKALDVIDGGEWDADIPKNIAPVLSRFIRGTYTKRRHHWAGLTRPDETAL